MSDPPSTYVSAPPLDPITVDVVKDVSQHLHQVLPGADLWVGLPEVVFQRLEVPGATPLPELLAAVPEDARPKLERCERVQQGLGLLDHLPVQTAPAESLHWVAVPIPLENYPPGVLLIAHPQSFSPQQIQAISNTASSTLAAPIEHGLLKHTARQYLSIADSLYAVLLRLFSTLDVEELLKGIAQGILRLMPADAAHVYLFYPEKKGPGRLEFGAALWRDGSREGEPPRPDSLSETVAQSGKPVIIDRTTTREVQDAHLSGWEVGAVACYPLARGGRTLGVLTVSYLQPHIFTVEERYLLALFVEQASVAIENAQVAARLSSRLNERTTLYELAHRSSASLEPEEVFEVVTSSLQALLGSFAVSILLLDEQGGLRLAATSGSEQVISGLSYLPPGKGISAKVVASGRPIYVPDVSKDPDYIRVDPHLQSLLVVPMIVKGRVIGTLSVDSQELDAFEPETERLVSIAAAQAAIAIENAQLFQAERRRADELNAISELSQSITQFLEIEQVFTAAHRAITKLLSGEAFYLAVRERPDSDVVVAYLIDKGHAYPPAHWPADAGLSGYIIQTGQSFLVRDVHTEEIPFTYLPYGDDEPVRSFIAVPLRYGSLILGAASLQSYQPGAFDEHDLHLFTLIADHIAVAVENAYLFADLQKRYLSLQELDRVRVEFIQNASHELRTPLTFVRSYVDLLLGEQMGELNYQQRQSLEIVQAKTEVLVRLVEDITLLEVDGSRLLVVKPVDLLELVRRVVRDIVEKTQVNPERLQLQAPPSMPQIEADGDRIAQVLENLIGNALKYGPAEGTVQIRLEAWPDEVVVSVRDQGHGIPEGEQERIFDRFYQVDGSTARRHGGLGLGLAIVKHIVEAHRGRVWVDNAEGAGSIFCFTIPYRFQPFPMDD